MGAAPGEIGLDVAAALIAARRDRQLDPNELVARLDRLAEEVVVHDAASLVEEMCGRLGFIGDRSEYGHERNSLLNHVLDRRQGLPILLSLVVAEVGRRHGIIVSLVGMPGRVLLCSPDEPETFIDPFDGGRRLGLSGCESLFGELHGPSATFGPEMLRPTPPLATIVRMLSNLITGYLTRGDWHNARWALEMRAAVPGWPMERNVDLAVVLGHLGRVEEAAAVWDRIADATGPPLSAQARERATRLRAGLN